MKGKKLKGDAGSPKRDYKIGSRVQFNELWHLNVHLSGSGESEAAIPGGTVGTVVGIDVGGIPGVYLVTSPLGDTTVHSSYIDGVKK